MKKVIAVITSLLMLSNSLFSCYAANSEEKSVIISEAPVSSYGERSALVKENYALAREAATEGIVLLENNGALPLGRSNTVTLFGIGSKRLIKGGSGSGLIYTKYFASLIDGMKNAEKAGLISLNDGLNALYEEHYAAWLEEYKDLSDIARESKEISELALTDEQVAAARAASDTAIYTISRVSGEGGDRKAVSGDYYIGDVEAANLAKIDAANFDNFIVIINAGTATDTSFINDYPSIDALIYAWLPGIEGGNALADIICGEVNPSGKLVDTLAKSFDDYPTSKSFYESNAYVNYSEDIYVGYRYFETFDPDYEKVNYCFGYGMSYTDFELSGDSVSSDGENINVTVTVTNTGSVSGKEVVQVYYSAPQGLLGNPAKELAGYAKTSLLAPGKSETVTVSFPISDMASFDDLGKTGHKAAYVLEAGDYAIYVGNSVKNAGERGIKGTYTQDTLEVTEQLTSLMTPKELKTRLTADGTYESLTVQETDTDGSYKLDLSDGDALVEAEDYHRASEGIESTVVPELDNLKYVSGLTTAKYLEYDVSVTEECELGIILSVSNPDTSVTAPFVIYVNGTATAAAPDIPNTQGSGTTPVFNDYTFSSSIFSAGKNTVRIESQSDEAGSLCIDSVIFKTAGERPRISATETTTIEAEDYSTYSDNGDTSLPIAKETAFGEVLVAKISKAGKYLEYELYCEEEGTYAMLFAYAATRDYTAPLDILVNGVNQNVTYSMPKTSPEGTSASDNPTAFYNTSAWMETPFKIKLPKGFVTLRLLAKGGCPNLNKFSLTKVFELPEGFSLVSGTESTVVEAENFAVKNPDEIGTAARLGETFVIYLSGAGRYLEYKLYFEKAGTYDVTLNCAASTNYTNPFTFYANDKLICEDDYTISSTVPEGVTSSSNATAFYYTAKDVATLPMTFPEGEVIFKVMSGSNVPNLNKFTFVPQTTDTPAEGETIPEGYTEVPKDEVLTVEIENYSRYSENMNFKVLADGNAKGEKIGENIHGGDWLEYDLWFSEAGTYLFNMNYAATANFANPFVFYANGEEITHDPYVAAKTATSSSWKDTYNYFFVFADMENPVKLTFPKGAVTFRIYGGGETGKSVPNLNKFTLEKTYNVPDGYALLSPKVTTVVEAENYDGVNNDPPSNQGDIATRNRESDLGLTFLEYLTSTTGGRWLEYNLYTATAGKYSFTINYASNASKANPFSFFADGVAIECADYTLAKTSVEGGTTAIEIYFQFKDSDPIELVLPKGKFTFRVLCGTGQMPNLNSMAFTLTEAIESTEPDEPEPEVPEADPTLEPGYAEDTSRLISYIDVINGKETMDDFLKQLTNLDLIRLAGGHPPVTGSSSSMGRLRKYDIPEVTTSDGGAGIRISAAYGATCWPCSTLIACTWNEELIERVGEGVGREAEVIRLDCWLAPGMNIHRNPLCGRNFEYFSEDPLVTGNCASRITIGAKKYGLHTVAKHFAVNNKETNRSNSDSRLSERALREIYLKGFEILVKTADPRYIMTSYNLINGVEAAESYDLCTAILRDEWGFNGIVMTDWMNNSVHMNEIKAGNNIKKQTGDLNGLVRQVRSGEITRDELKANAKVILETLADSMSARFAANPVKVNRDGATYIKATEFSFSNDDQPGIVTTAFTKNGFSYKVGDYFDAGSWNPGLLFTANGGIGMNIYYTVSNSNAVFADPGIFLEYIVDVEEAGLYSIECFASSNYAAVSVDGSEYKNLQTLSSAKAASFNRTSPLTLELSAGKHSIKVRSALIGYVAITPYYGSLPKDIDCKIYTGCDSGFRIAYTTEGSEKGDYTHLVPDFSSETKVPISDHWGLAVDESVYKYLVLCYRTNYTGEARIQAQAGGNTATYDGTLYKFTPDKQDAWTTSTIELTSGLTLRQIHMYPFGATVENVTEDMYFDLLHIGFFKTEADAAEYCKSHSELPLKGSLVLSRESGVKLYDDITTGYQSTAVVTLTKDGKTVSVIREQESSIVDENGNASFAFSFDVPDGEYTLTVKKPGYVTYTQNITVEGGACDISAIYMIPGDITDSMENLYGDGVVDVYDFIRLIRAFAPDASAKFRMFTDIDEDGNVTISDLALLKVSFKNTHS